MQHHHYSLTELEDMIPWERQIYVALLKQYIEDENLKQKQKSKLQWIQRKVMTEENKTHPADTNGDGKVSKEEHDMFLEFKRKELEDNDAMRDAQRQMTWFALFGLLLYPFAVVLASLVGLDEAQKTLGSMAPTYFVAVAGIVAAFFGAQAYSKKQE